MTIRKGSSYRDRPPHDKTEETRQFERELDEETTELLRDGLTEHGIEWRSGLKGVTFVGEWCFVEYDNGKLAATCEPVLTPDQAIAATLGSEQELIDLAHNTWSMALCAMQGMPIPADWGNAVERGLRKYGIDVDGELAGFEVVSA